MKIITNKEFQAKGYLQEVNRLFFHPLGLAIAIQDENLEESKLLVLDYRDDPEGVYYDLANANDERINKFATNAESISLELKNKSASRLAALNFIIEPIKNIC